MREASPLLTVGAIAAAVARLAGRLPLILVALLLLAGIAAAQEPAIEACAAGRDIRAEIDDPAMRAEIAAETAAVPNGIGRLFRIERDGIPASHLYGTMHMSDPRVLALPAPAEAAFGAARRLVIESTDILDETRMAAALFARPELTILPAGERLGSLVPADRLDALSQTLSATGAPLGSVETLQPWFVAVMLATPPCEAARQQAGAAVLDVDLARRAQAAGITVEGLETGLEQLEALASLPRDLQVENLLAAVDLVDRIPDIFETMTILYLDGAIAAITPTIERLAPAGTDAQASAAVYAAYEARIIDRRNAIMAERLAPKLADGSVFAAVGALHLPGEQGLVELLRARGWTVTRVD